MVWLEIFEIEYYIGVINNIGNFRESFFFCLWINIGK